MAEQVGWFERSKRRLKALIDEYGYIALGVYLGLSILTIAGGYVAIQSGMETESSAGPLAGAWAFGQLLRPVKVALTVVLTPFVARVIKRPNISPIVEPDADLPLPTPASEDEQK